MNLRVLVLVLVVLAACRSSDAPRRQAAAAAIDGGCGSASDEKLAAAPRPQPASDDNPAAGMSYERHARMMGPEGYIASTLDEVVVATVEAIVSTHAATHRNPPTVRLRITDVLRGDPGVDRSVVVWAAVAPLNGGDEFDTTDREEEAKAYARRFQAEMRTWGETPMCPPDVGASFVLVGKVGPRGFELYPPARLPATAENLAVARRAIAWPEQNRRAEAERSEARRKQNEATLSAWRKRATRATARRMTLEADLVAIAVPQGTGFDVREVLKGPTQVRGVPPVAINPEVAELLQWERDRKVLLFLDEVSVDVHNRVTSTVVGEGVLPADPDLVRYVDGVIE